MEVIIKTKNLKLTEFLEKYINEKINSLERFLSKKIPSSPSSLTEFPKEMKVRKRIKSSFDSFRKSSVEEDNFLVKARVEIEKTALHHKKGPFFRAECQMQTPEKNIRAESVSENLYLAISEVKDELQREIKKYKNTLIAKQKRGARVFKKEIHLSSQARFYRKGRIKEEGI